MSMTMSIPTISPHISFVQLAWINLGTVLYVYILTYEILAHNLLTLTHSSLWEISTELQDIFSHGKLEFSLTIGAIN